MYVSKEKFIIIQNPEKKHTVGGKNSFENDEVLADILMQVCIS